MAGKWLGVVGLEVHAQISSKSKLFSNASVQFASPINSLVSHFDAALPGTLPVLNQHCVKAGILTALSLNCHVNQVSMFDRKHYFYADLPAGYQITQQFYPLATDGYLEFMAFNPTVHKKPLKLKSAIKQIQLEQDSGKSLHDEDSQQSLIDLNRAGVGLMEIVFEPDLKDGEEAAALIKDLCLLLERIGTCDCKMEEGSLRVDANISVHRSNEPLGVRCEVKNLNSVRAVANAIQFEIDRQIKLLDKGVPIVNETRSYDSGSKQTVPMRDKEVKQDYRFLPEPNLPPLRLIDDDIEDSSCKLINIATLRRSIPELPQETRVKLCEKHGIRMDTCMTLVNNLELLNLFNEITLDSPSRSGYKTAGFIVVDLMGLINKEEIPVSQSKVNAPTLGQIIDLITDGSISSTVAHQVLELIWNGDTRHPKEIVIEKKWERVYDEELLTRLCLEAIEQNPKKVRQYRNGKARALNPILAHIRKSTDLQIDMDIVDKMLPELIMKSVKEET